MIEYFLFFRFRLFLYRSIFREIETPRKVFWQWNQNQFPALFMGLLLNHFPENLIFTYILHQNYRVQKYFSQVFTLYPSLSYYMLLSQILNIYCLDSICKEASLKDTRIWVCWSGASELGGQGGQVPTHIFALPLLKRDICPPTSS